MEKRRPRRFKTRREADAKRERLKPSGRAFFQHKEKESKGMNHGRHGKDGKGRMGLWNCGIVGLWKCGIVELWELGMQLTQPDTRCSIFGHENLPEHTGENGTDV